MLAGALKKTNDSSGYIMFLWKVSRMLIPHGLLAIEAQPILRFESQFSGCFE